MSDALCADLRSMDPVSYIRSVGLRPEDSYGFLAVEHRDDTALVFLYRDRPEYAQARTALPGPQSSERLLGGLIEVEPVVHLDVDIDLGALGAAPPTAVPTATAGATIASHRMYPGLRTRASSRQLDHYLPRYAEDVGIHAEDVFGLLTRGIKFFGGTAREWESTWLVYRDRPEYAPGREHWAQERAKRGGWPEVEISAGSDAPPRPISGPARVEVERTRWPKSGLLKRASGDELGARLVEQIGKLGYAPEYSLGLCPDFDHKKVYYAWSTA